MDSSIIIVAVLAGLFCVLSPLLLMYLLMRKTLKRMRHEKLQRALETPEQKNARILREQQRHQFQVAEIGDTVVAGGIAIFWLGVVFILGVVVFAVIKWSFQMVF